MNKLPSDCVNNILSFLNNSEIKKMNLPYEYYKHYLKNRLNVNKPELWYRGCYNNLNHGCFLCNKELYTEVRMLVICFDCELLIDDYCNYPNVCLGCIKTKETIKRGKVFGAYCQSCNSNRMVIAVECYS